MTTANKISEQQTLEEKIADFLNQGGEIQQIPYGETAPKVDYKKRGWGAKKTATEEPKTEEEEEE